VSFANFPIVGAAAPTPSTIKLCTQKRPAAIVYTLIGDFNSLVTSSNLVRLQPKSANHAERPQPICGGRLPLRFESARRLRASSRILGSGASQADAVLTDGKWNSPSPCSTVMCERNASRKCGAITARFAAEFFTRSFRSTAPRPVFLHRSRRSLRCSVATLWSLSAEATSSMHKRASAR
jgi:hypothetical protein